MRATLGGALVGVLALAWAGPGCSSSGGATATGGSGGTGGGTASTGGGTGTGAVGGTGDPTVLVGSFLVKLIAPSDASSGVTSVGSTSVVGKVSDGPTPAINGWETLLDDGDCHLLKPRAPFCATPCGGSAVCVDTNTCRSYPTTKSVGDVTLTGLTTNSGASEITLASAAGVYQLPVGVSCPFPAFTEGSPVKLRSTGGDYAPLNLTASGIAPLSLTNQELPLTSGQPLTLTWKAAASPSASHIHVKLDISHHGGSRGMISCDTADDGSVTLSAALVTQLLSLGVAGFPTVIVTRTATNSAVLAPGRVDLVLSSEVETAVQIQGVVSCTSDDPCVPLGKHCATDLTCQ